MELKWEKKKHKVLISLPMAVYATNNKVIRSDAIATMCLFV